ncbi:hypothetical protein [Mycolicibacterium thermoresistibile]|uniref:Uncharacterized protein n=2 Tax=Mycolicibacterium thermoresistibile TaxID=1797 RepID=G7CGH9_MYCT3|nr:hypothetical protein [Mycolicibacterium thermoresistibile]EHI11939.1 hypothetical protein KEK_13608 [Mycolicibacterium thermoresistibile ATCC 19527]MCV7188983.1 hypothetical protein [Mycolicibacterium thermoresistibile]GAT14831.1 putative uncharacterized protein [Mycolicibacterium thermoresistibile]SNW20055.1 Uncharacterised protein [Mycolicibacterium thermoresistibile]
MNTLCEHRLGLGAAGCGLALLLGAGLFGSGPATADPTVVGEPFGDAASSLRDAGRTVVIGAVVGNNLPLEQCIVTNMREVSALRPATVDEEYPQYYADGGEVQLSVNCDVAPRSQTPEPGAAASDTGRDGDQ